jgi:phosphomannomutase
VLRPIDPDTVIRNGGASGRFPDEIHEAVAWWMGACLVVVLEASRIAVAHDGTIIGLAFHQRLLKGAANARHYACTVTDCGAAGEAELLAAGAALGGVPAVRISTTGPADAPTVTIALFDARGLPLAEDSGLAQIRHLVATDRVPIPVNAAAEGRVEPYAPAALEGEGR